MELFEKWINPSDHTEGAIVYSENQTGQATNHNTDSWSELNTYQPISFNKIVHTAPACTARLGPDRDRSAGRAASRDVAVAAATAACDSSGTTSADAALAGQLNDQLDAKMRG